MATHRSQNFNKIVNIFIKFGSINPILIALICWVTVIIGSWIYDFHRPPEFYMSDKRNIFNVLFAKWSLAWTLALLTPFVVLTHFVKSRYNMKVVCKHGARLVVAFVVWFSVTYVLEWFEHMTGECEGSDLYSSKYECLEEGLVWNGFDISGHSFLLVYCMLIISEEIQVVRFWTPDAIHTNKAFFSNEMVNSSRVHFKNLPQRPNSHSQLTSKNFVGSRYIGLILFICCCLLMMIFLMLLALTAIYFHTVNSKVLGVSIGLSSWILTYKVCFVSKYFPGMAVGF